MITIKLVLLKQNLINDKFSRQPVSQQPQWYVCRIASYPSHVLLCWILNKTPKIQKSDKYGEKTNWINSSLASQYYQEQLKQKYQQLYGYIDHSLNG